MAYSIEKYTVKVNGTSSVQVIGRETAAVQKTVELSTQNVKIFLEEGEEDFDVVGTLDQQGEYVNEVNPNPNDITLTTDGELIHIGSDSIEMAIYNAYICKDGNCLCFYQASVYEASKTKAA